LLETSHDHHFFLEFNPERADLIRATRSRSESQIDQARKKILDDARWHNFGFRKLERLRGNVGYLDLRSFSDPAYAGETAQERLYEINWATDELNQRFHQVAVGNVFSRNPPGARGNVQYALTHGSLY